ncbi:MULTISPECIES: Na+/H+ antiporter NhaC [unclassified Modicisalibacter]|uniref:Na+/H+ antiporter NhaC n=1 Tax=unclassified Modicisalibacter TaxID=2679913 RepID=UPI001CCEC85F|nr:MULTISPECIES: Na+/H+ antiporter NhaC [unclassified Modicisalibacter]MBZ9558504.1 Na+/H+ antiporter NhaC [Modicisalibacter sp. R2A 31.J]MBZ9575604.1 Na+/H+ antiporter NhaC [Modicisalibacter sp. MOD 31.J]
MSTEVPVAGKKKISLLMAILPIVLTLALLIVNIFVFGGDPHVPLIIGVAICSIIGLGLGMSWDEVEEGMIQALKPAIPVIGILMTIGMLISTWIVAGTVPLLINLGVDLISPQFFLPIACVICSFTSLLTGTSWGTTGTIGLALISIGEVLGVPTAYTAGAVISGAFFGDKISPLSETTNAVPVMVGTDLWTHIRNMLPSTVPAMLIALIVYTYLGYGAVDGQATLQRVTDIKDALGGVFNLNWFLLLPPLITGVMCFKKVPALPGMFSGVIVGGLVALFAQGVSIGTLLDVMMNGYHINTGADYLDTLLSKGGLMSMMYIISLMIIALMFGGLLLKIGSIERIVTTVVSKLRSRGKLVTGTLLTSLGITGISDQWVAYTITGQTFSPAFRGLGLSTANVSRIAEDTGTLCAPLFPWTSAGVFIAGVTGVQTIIYAPFAIACWLSPVFDLIWGWTGWFVPKATPEDAKRWERNNDPILVEGVWKMGEVDHSLKRFIHSQVGSWGRRKSKPKPSQVAD